MKSIQLFALIPLLVATLAPVSAAETKRTLIQNRGSDSMAIAVVRWAEEYKRNNTSIGVAVSGGGTGTGISALLNGTVDIANASRAMNRREINLARDRGIAPVQHVTGYDGIAIYVHNDNPVKSLSFSQIADIFGNGGPVHRWSDIGVEVPGCDDQKIVRVGRQNSSGTYAYLRHNVLGGKRFKQGTLEAQSSKDLVGLVTATPCAIGYSSFVYATPEVKVACLSEHAGEPCLTPGIEDVAERTYPISRPLYMYTNGPASGDVKTYLDWILSDAGQCILLNSRYAAVREVRCEN
ncbi:MAG: PstS family phosphate ABC transporter substrate-binding protein [Thiotrichales bacterium]|nr:MAG: PstS family phosphate ABC transporter substrate-binding protein [Thiotrichales bacterium]